jgi:hypothetical protein
MNPRASVLLGLLGPLALGACRLPEAHVYNLREVREPDGSARRVGAPMKVAEYVVRNSVLLAMSGGELASAAQKEADVVEDPDAIALDNLIQLGRCDRSDPWVLGLQVEMATWLAVDDGYRLARERAVIALGELGRALGVAVPLQLEPGDVPATPDDLVGPLGDLVRHVRVYLQLGTPPGPELAEACAELREQVLDRDGARRVMAAANALLEQGGRDAPALAPLAELFRFSAARAVGLALGEALRDRDPVVRAAAFEASLVASDDELAGLRIQGLQDPAEEVLVAVLAGIRDRGLKVPAGLGPEDVESMRLAFTDQMIALTRDLRGTVSCTACAALARVTDSGLTTYRWEEWNRWWEREVAASPAAGAADRAGS